MLAASRPVAAILRVAHTSRAGAAYAWARWWVRWPVGAAILIVVLLIGDWTVRYGWAIYRLNRGVGGTTFLDASGKPWFPLDDARQDVPLDRIATFAKDAVIAVEDHRFYLHPGVDPVGLTRAVIYNAGWNKAGRVAAR